MSWPWETKTSTCRNFATISSGLYRFLAIAVLLDVDTYLKSDHFVGGGSMHSKKLTRFVGRQNELHQLYGRISKALLDRIVGDPHVVIRLQCSPYHTNSPFYPIITQH